MIETDFEITDGIPFVMTKQMRADLVERGMSNTDIRRLTPMDALEFLKSKATVDEWFKPSSD